MIKKIVAATALTGGLVLAGAGLAAADAGAEGAAVHSPGVASGNVVQVPVNIPVNICGNSVSVIGLLNPVFGNTCVNH
ncbi:chaplin [Streptomyces sp. NPDC050560]|uniref:chaplin n=1 Tax=Streptomyces sp. NPDC050560 TaxID=3365630 RepID=UPI0037B98928